MDTKLGIKENQTVPVIPSLILSIIIYPILASQLCYAIAIERHVTNDLLFYGKCTCDGTDANHLS